MAHFREIPKYHQNNSKHPANILPYQHQGSVGVAHHNGREVTTSASQTISLLFKTKISVTQIALTIILYCD